MATNGIATRANANAIVAGAYASDTSRCVTYSSINATNLFIITPSYSGKYTNATNRLVLTSELSAKPKARILFKINDYTTKRLINVTVTSIIVKGIKVLSPGDTTELTLVGVPILASEFTTGGVVITGGDTGTYTFTVDNATVVVNLSDGSFFEGTCDFSSGTFVLEGDKVYTQSINAVEGDNYLTLSIRGTHTMDPPVIDTVQFKVRLLFSITELEVYSFKIGIGDWTIRNGDGTVLASGSFPATEYRPSDLPQELIGNGTGNSQAYYYIDLYASGNVTNTSPNEPLYIQVGSAVFQYKTTSTSSFMLGNTTVVNLLAPNYGYTLLESNNEYIKHFKIDCRS